MRLVLATGNVGKQRELAALLAPRGCELILQTTLGICAVDETGRTFEANALLKARHASREAGLPALADDSGLEVDALDGRPGVHSARHAGARATDAENLALLLDELTGVPEALRSARYRCVIAFVRSPEDPQPLIAAGSWEGRIATTPVGTGGFGYDPAFIAEHETRTVAQMSAAEKNAASHRAKALAALIAQWR